MSEFLLNVVRRGAGLPTAVAPRERRTDEEPSEDALERVTVEAGPVPGVTPVRSERPAPQPPATAPAPEPAPLAPSGTDRSAVSRTTPERRSGTFATAAGASRQASPRAERPFTRVQAPSEETASAGAPTVPTTSAGHAPSAPQPMAPAPAAQAVAPLRPLPALPRESAGPRTGHVPRVAASPVSSIEPPPGLRHSASAEPPSPEDKAAGEGPPRAPARVQPAAAPVLAWPVADSLPAPRVDVHIGRIEILPPAVAAPPPSPPRRRPRGFAEHASARSHRDRRWY